MTHRNLVVLAAFFCTVACTERGAVYQQPIAQARKTLLATGLPPTVFGTNDPAFDVRDERADVVWIVRMNDAEVFRYTAYLTEEGPAATRVKVELKGVENGPTGNTVKSLDEHPQIRDMYLVAVKEQIASSLEHRPFEIARVYPSMGLAVASNIGQLNASADAAAAASNKADRDNIEKAYRDEAAGHW